ncbi:MAG: hypothetical protein U0236_20835, partial [Nitrospira sp.]
MAAWYTLRISSKASSDTPVFRFDRHEILTAPAHLPQGSSLPTDANPPLATHRLPLSHSDLDGEIANTLHHPLFQHPMEI